MAAGGIEMAAGFAVNHDVVTREENAKLQEFAWRLISLIFHLNLLP
jgi:hypothetical protein